MLLRQMDAVLAALGDTTARVLAMEEREKQQNATIQQVTPRPRLHTLSDDPSKPSCCPALNRVWARAQLQTQLAAGGGGATAAVASPTRAGEESLVQRLEKLEKVVARGWEGGGGGGSPKGGSPKGEGKSRSSPRKGGGLPAPPSQAKLPQVLNQPALIIQTLDLIPFVLIQRLSLLLPV